MKKKTMAIIACSVVAGYSLFAACTVLSEKTKYIIIFAKTLPFVFMRYTRKKVHVVDSAIGDIMVKNREDLKV